ncbi:MAG: M28 family peptidase [Gemmatimonadales bacterium]|nr:M28 family peptidase [Gemmatimonadales bacterium]
MRAPFLLTIIALGLTADLAGQSVRKADPRLSVIRPEWIAASIRYLADDALRGRETGQPGAELAAKYVAAQFEAAGLQPLDGFPNYLMPVPLRHSTVVASETRASLSRSGVQVPLALDVDFLVHPDKRLERDGFEGEVVFVGWGVTVPGGYDDYQGVDVRGKVVAMFFGGPASVPPDERGHYSSLAMKGLNARRHGAVGVVTLMPAPGPQLGRQLGQLEGFGWVDPDGAAHSPFFETGTALRLAATGMDKLLEGTGATVAGLLERLARGPASFSTGARLAFEGVYRHRSVVAHNALGVLPGTDPVLKREYVVYSAHLDHIGVGQPVDGDSVHHGAIDNAGGTAVVAALARAFASLPRPKRSVIFLAVTGEEKGILGSDYFVHHPPVPLGAIVANVNLDNAVLIEPIRDLVAYGADYSTLGAVARSAFARLGVAPSKDPLPEMTIFTRSDHYAFMRAGVPGLMLFPGASRRDGQRRWFGSVHHTPRDRFDQGIDWGAAVTYATANLLIGSEVANQRERPRWIGTPFFRREE